MHRNVGFGGDPFSRAMAAIAVREPLTFNYCRFGVPRETNDTDIGRARNRRVEPVPQ